MTALPCSGCSLLRNPTGASETQNSPSHFVGESIPSDPPDSLKANQAVVLVRTLTSEVLTFLCVNSEIGQKSFHSVIQQGLATSWSIHAISPTTKASFQVFAGSA